MAAPYFAALPKNVLKDVVPFRGPGNLTASYQVGDSVSRYSAAELAGPLDNTRVYMSVLWVLTDTPNAEDLGLAALSFGTDTSLQTAVGWDDVTGWGTLDFAGVDSLVKPRIP